MAFVPPPPPPPFIHHHHPRVHLRGGGGIMRIAFYVVLIVAAVVIPVVILKKSNLCKSPQMVTSAPQTAVDTSLGIDVVVPLPTSSGSTRLLEKNITAPSRVRRSHS
ncbi:hypothetical protein FNYG_07559 [Fusarium nygamai]|uniref:Uncharacterized protein n=1 Tax=Gibberella nygamai TaxID=42673 RepID=A0A2K0WA59_GIBNY|nr:hypothetical protein FNYG_07559 [Fusarium nygamai]